ncbi:hypothetical protein EA187_04845 [Lujinxingia sediminis]|uniref:FAD/NAD(P)-binding domain-containing protein n=1 Tax=Lujinxingia sediminis TaxID=2480984 RepID=A0ABY0CY09_9DELT|nr:NAD(P)/FAD-dependent oxidoreductase [Lujinxingia sediminis]RVU48762.1 hypothetical protein EA187_04845 [Lujinxingia sediminis]
MSDEARALIVGGGVAAVSAALWLHDFGVPFDWVDARGEVGGMLLRVNNRIGNFPGSEWTNGRELASALREQVSKHELRPREATLLRLLPDTEALSPALRADFEGLPSRHYEAAALATGSRYRTLGVPGELEGMGRHVSQSAMADAERFAGREVAVVGGGDAALENALRLASFDCRVHLLMRCAPRARESFLAEARQNPLVTLWPTPTRVTRISPVDEGCELTLQANDARETLRVAALFVRIGIAPVLPDVPGLELDARGFVHTDANRRTGLPGVFAIGDICHTPLRSVATASGDGALAARLIATDLGYL